MIRPTETKDTKQICDIYNHYILNTIVTFEEEAVEADSIQERIEQTQSNNLPWLVFEENDNVLGFAYASKWKSRCAYKHSVESTIYLAQDAMGRGLARSLYGQLLEDIKRRNIHAIIGGIALPNDASIALHERLGFEKVAHFKEVGFKFNEWIDVAYWELLL